MTNIPIQVYGINLLVKLMAEGPADVRVHCPKGSPIRYGEVVARGDGFDEGANAFREMPDLKTVVAFEESPEEVEGHYFYIAREDYRVIRLDSVILSFPRELSRPPRVAGETARPPRTPSPHEPGVSPFPCRSRRAGRAHTGPDSHPERGPSRRSRGHRGGCCRARQDVAGA